MLAGRRDYIESCVTSVPVLERAFAVAVLFVITNGLLPLLRRNSTSALEASAGVGDPFMQKVYILINLVTLLLLLTRWKAVVRTAFKDQLLWLLVGLALISTLWSARPETTLLRTVSLLGSTLFGVYLAERYRLQDQVRLLAWALGLAAVLSLLFALLLPAYGLVPYESGAWRGIYVEKNLLGRIMVLSALVFLLLPRIAHKHGWIAVPLFGLSAVLAVLSDSTTAPVLLFALMLVLLVCVAVRENFALAIFFSISVISLALPIVIWMMQDWTRFLDPLGKDPTLTGRTVLWSLSLDLVRERPLLGYGYSAVWGGGDDAPAAYIRDLMGWDVPNAHNGFLDLTLGLGLLGLVVFLVGYLQSYFRAIRWLRVDRTACGLWPLIYLTFLFLYNVTENTAVVSNSIFWVLYVSTWKSLSLGPVSIGRNNKDIFAHPLRLNRF